MVHFGFLILKILWSILKMSRNFIFKYKIHNYIFIVSFSFIYNNIDSQYNLLYILNLCIWEGE